MIMTIMIICYSSLVIYSQRDDDRGCILVIQSSFSSLDYDKVNNYNDDNDYNDYINIALNIIYIAGILVILTLLPRL